MYYVTHVLFIISTVFLMCTIVCLLFVYVSSYVANSECRCMQISSGSLGTRLSANSTRSQLELELDSKISHTCKNNFVFTFLRLS